MNSLQKTSKGFTLVEMMIAVAIGGGALYGGYKVFESVLNASKKIEAKTLGGTLSLEISKRIKNRYFSRNLNSD